MGKAKQILTVLNHSLQLTLIIFHDLHEICFEFYFEGKHEINRILIQELL